MRRRGPQFWWVGSLAAAIAGAVWWRRTHVSVSEPRAPSASQASRDQPLVLAEHPDLVRSTAVDLVRRFVPSDTGDASFDEIARDYGGKGTTCGYLCHWLLWRLGCRDAKLVNREDSSAGVHYRAGANIAALRWNPWFHVRQAGETPLAGDLYFISNGPSVTEHVGVVLDVRGDVLTCADAGQRNAQGAQCARITERRLRSDGLLERLDGGSAPRALQGWVDLAKVPFTAPAMLSGPQQRAA